MRTSIQLTGFSTLLRLLVLVLTIEFTSSGFAQTFIPEYLDGLGYSAGWNYLKNRGQVYDLDGDPRSDVLFHSVGTVPSIYAMDAIRTAVTFAAYDSIDHQNDKVCRLDFYPTGEAVRVSVPFAYDPLPMKYNFYETYTPQGVTNVTGSQRIIYPNIYSKIDYHILSDRYGPKFLYVVRPGGNPDDLLLRFEGQDSLNVDVDGMLRLYVGTKQTRLNQGMAYQQVGNTIVPVTWVPSYENQHGSALVSFDFGAFDPTKPLIIQITPLNPAAYAPPPPPGPTPEWCTYIPGSGQEDFVADMTAGVSGYVHYTGHSNSTAGLPINGGIFIQPNLAGATDAIVGRFNQFYETNADPNAWLTYYGASNLDQGFSIAAHAGSDRLAVCGSSYSPSGTLVQQYNANSDQWNGSDFMAVFNMSNGTLLYGTRVPFGSGTSMDVDYDAAGNLYWVGTAYMDAQVWPYVDLTGTADYFAPSAFQLGPNYWDAFIMRFDGQMQLTWSTALGGPGDDQGLTCKVNRASNVLYIGGTTSSTNDPNNPDCPDNGWNSFPICTGGGFSQQYSGSLYDGFITRFDLNTMGMGWSTFFGGWQDDVISDIAIDGFSRVYICGNSKSSGYSNTPCGWAAGDQFPSCINGQYFETIITASGFNHFIARFDAYNALTWSTLIQGSKIESAQSIARTRIACDSQNNVFLQGSTQSGCDAFDFSAAPLVYNASFYNKLDHNDLQLSPPTVPKFDTYVAGFDASGTPFYGTYIGGLGDEWSGGICAVDDRLYISGGTAAVQQFPTNAPAIAGHSPYLQSASSTAGDIDGYFAQLRYDLTTGVSEVPREEVNDLSLYPNPASNMLTVAFGIGQIVQEVQVVDMTGRIVYRTLAIGVRSIQLEVASYSPGVYSIMAIGNGHRYTGRFIKD